MKFWQESSLWMPVKIRVWTLFKKADRSSVHESMMKCVETSVVRAATAACLWPFQKSTALWLIFEAECAFFFSFSRRCLQLRAPKVGTLRMNEARWAWACIWGGKLTEGSNMNFSIKQRAIDVECEQKRRDTIQEKVFFSKFWRLELNLASQRWRTSIDCLFDLYGGGMQLNEWCVMKWMKIGKRTKKSSCKNTQQRKQRINGLKNVFRSNKDETAKRQRRVTKLTGRK